MGLVKKKRTGECCRGKEGLNMILHVKIPPKEAGVQMKWGLNANKSSVSRGRKQGYKLREEKYLFRQSSQEYWG